MDAEELRSRVRDVLLGGVLGASAVIAAARRKRPLRADARRSPQGLAAFEDAPCYHETVEREAAEARHRSRP
jgi:hypothetical protein